MASAARAAKQEAHRMNPIEPPAHAPADSVILELQRHGFAPKMVLDNAIVGICFVVNRRMLWTNPRMAQILGYDEGELDGQEIRRVFASQDEYDSLGSIYRSMTRHNRHVHESRLLSKNGEVLWCMLSGRLVDAKDSGSPSVWVMQDVSDRRKAQDQLLRTAQRLEQTVAQRTRSLQRSNAALHTEVERRRAAQVLSLQSREKYRSLFRRLPLGVLVTNLRGEVVEYNPSLQRSVGAPTKAGFEAAIHDPARVRVAGQAQALLGLLHAHATGDGPREASFDFVWLTRSGRPRDISVVAAPLKGEAPGFIYTFTDVTERLRLREREQQQRDALAHADRVALMGQMASALAHELGQPLNACQSYVTGLRMRLAEMPPQAKDLVFAVDKIGAQLAQAGEIIHNVRGFVTRQPALMAKTRLIEVIERTLGLLAVQFRSAAVKPTITIEPGLPEVICNPVEIQQVLVNLLVNALDAMRAVPAGQRALELRVRRGRASLLSVTVSDAGEGIPPLTAKRLFEPYFTTKPAGLGMGLMICRTIIEAHGGSIRHVPSKTGTSFRFTLRAKE